MLVKVFTSKGPLTGAHGKLRHKGGQFYTLDRVLSLEEEINRWLVQNPAISILEIEQSLVSGWFGGQRCLITVWYEPPKVVLTKEEAQKLVLEHVSSPDASDDVVITEVMERPFGWVFCYNSKRYVETGDEGHRLLGNHPILVDRHNCTLHFTGLGKIEEYIERYVRTGQTSVEPVITPTSR